MRASPARKKKDKKDKKKEKKKAKKDVYTTCARFSAIARAFMFVVVRISVRRAFLVLQSVCRVVGIMWRQDGSDSANESPSPTAKSRRVTLEMMEAAIDDSDSLSL